MTTGIYIHGAFIGSDMTTFKDDDGSQKIRNIVAVACGVDCFKVFLADGQQIPPLAIGDPISIKVRPYVSKSAVGYSRGEIEMF